MQALAWYGETGVTENWRFHFCPEYIRMDGHILPLDRDLEFIYEQLALPDVEYSFKHALTHEVAYNSMLQERRRMIHERVGNAFEAIYGERIEEHLSQIAHHYGHSANVPKADDYLKRAGEQAAER
jgi:predicted ATPase